MPHNNSNICFCSQNGSHTLSRASFHMLLACRKPHHHSTISTSLLIGPVRGARLYLERLQRSTHRYPRLSPVSRSPSTTQRRSSLSVSWTIVNSLASCARTRSSHHRHYRPSCLLQFRILRRLAQQLRSRRRRRPRLVTGLWKYLWAHHRPLQATIPVMMTEKVNRFRKPGQRWTSFSFPIIVVGPRPAALLHD